MSVKSTVRLTRQEAEDRYVEQRLRVIVEEQRGLLKNRAKAIADELLEDAIERLNDYEKGGEGYENYLIVSDASERG